MALWYPRESWGRLMGRVWVDQWVLQMGLVMVDQLVGKMVGMWVDQKGHRWVHQ